MPRGLTIDIDIEGAKRHIKDLQIHAESLTRALNTMTSSLTEAMRIMKEYWTVAENFNVKNSNKEKKP